MIRFSPMLCLVWVLLSCNYSAPQKAISIEGLANADGRGNIKVRDEQTGRWFSVETTKKPLPKDVAEFRSSYEDRCWFRLFGVKVSGVVQEKNFLNVTSFEVTKYYSDDEARNLLQRIDYQPLQGKHTCGSK